MSALQSLAITQMLQRGSIEEVDVLRLKSTYAEAPLMSADEAEAMYALNEACRQQDPGWSVFFVDAMTDYIVNQTEPEGYLTAEEAKRLVERLAPDGRVARKTDLDLIVNVIDVARWSPVGLCRVALDQVKRAVITGEGPLRAGEAPAPGGIRANEVELVRRILYAFGGGACVAIARPEAEALFDINDALVTSEANGAWTDLFVKAVTNCVMAASGLAVPPREEALRRDAWLMEAAGGQSPSDLMSAMVAASVDSVRAAYREQTLEERALARLEQQRIEIITNEPIASVEAAWLCERMGRDGRLTTGEAALIAYLKRESQRIHPQLRATVDRLAEAA